MERKLADNNIFLPAKIPKNDIRRVEAVKRTGVLDVDNKDLFIVYNELAKQISNMPVSYTALIDQNRQFFLCHIGMPDDLPDSLPRESTFCQFTINSTKPLIVSDCKNDDRFKNHPIVCGPPFVTFYGGFPIISESGYVLGTLCLTDVDPKANLSSYQIDLLVKLTGRLAHQLDIQSEQREFTASKTIDLLRSVKKIFPNFNTINSYLMTGYSISNIFYHYSECCFRGTISSEERHSTIGCNLENMCYCSFYFISDHYFYYILH